MTADLLQQQQVAPSASTCSPLPTAVLPLETGVQVGVRNGECIFAPLPIEANHAHVERGDFARAQLAPVEIVDIGRASSVPARPKLLHVPEQMLTPPPTVSAQVTS